jgi:hypothetical protein
MSWVRPKATGSVQSHLCSSADSAQATSTLRGRSSASKSTTTTLLIVLRWSPLQRLIPGYAFPWSAVREIVEVRGLLGAPVGVGFRLRKPARVRCGLCPAFFGERLCAARSGG